MKVRIDAHTDDEHGRHVPGDIIDLSEGEAENYCKKNWGHIRAEDQPVKEPVKETMKPPERAVIETPENNSAAEKRETATLTPKRTKK